MNEALQDPTVRGAAIIVTALLLTQLVKELSERYAESKLLLRAVVLAVCAGGAFIAAWGPDGQVAYAEWWGVFWPTVTTAEFSYQWVLKALGNWRSGRAKPAVVGMAAVGVTILLILSAPPSQAMDWNDLVPETGGVCMVTANGLGRAALTGSYSLHDDGDWRVDLDLMLANDGSSGAGISVALTPLATLLELRDRAPFVAELADRTSVGAALLHSGQTFDAGLYWKLALREWRF